MDYVFLLFGSSLLFAIISGLFGIGGGLVMTPILFKGFQLIGVEHSICMNLAIGTSLGVIAPTSIMAFIEHKRRGTVDIKILKSWMIVLPASSILTSFMVSNIDHTYLQRAFAVFCVLIGFLMLVKDRWVLKHDFPDGFLKYILGMIIGIVSGILGVGGGILSTILMLLYGRSINQASAIATGVSVLISIPGLIVRIYTGLGVAGNHPMSIGFVNIGAIMIILPISIIICPISAKFSYMIRKKYLEIGFSLIMFVTALLLI
ncbi:MAG: sulfite exporter TauE/SafE family protein [Candidatus Liberibacter europaeus]|uniref:Probable membrane transporter protein n=1 Tax=Candidatus Liberibacter europaeus TaxID=744859 RepID=A0A2T4VWY5_9HYPH|nr:sulfite exporter TauE/SafE family protein [Candidatus Liberibacter europaeus]PTL86287.1 MAG: sulfite exporter TauE/SafE family protein [Candidatus Liberibacter europaeus]